MKKIISKTLIALVLLIFFYSSVYFYVKYKYSAVKPTSFTASIFDKEERVRVVMFSSQSKFDLAIYGIFLPISKVEAFFDKEFMYEIFDVSP